MCCLAVRSSIAMCNFAITMPFSLIILHYVTLLSECCFPHQILFSLEYHLLLATNCSPCTSYSRLCARRMRSTIGFLLPPCNFLYGFLYQLFTLHIILLDLSTHFQFFCCQPSTTRDAGSYPSQAKVIFVSYFAPPATPSPHHIIMVTIVPPGNKLTCRMRSSLALSIPKGNMQWRRPIGTYLHSRRLAKKGERTWIVDPSTLRA